MDYGSQWLPSVHKGEVALYLAAAMREQYDLIAERPISPTGEQRVILDHKRREADAKVAGAKAMLRALWPDVADTIIGRAQNAMLGTWTELNPRKGGQ